MLGLCVCRFRRLVVHERQAKRRAPPQKQEVTFLFSICYSRDEGGRVKLAKLCGIAVDACNSFWARRAVQKTATPI